jgi:acyl-CoA thioester hydrolase
VAISVAIPLDPYHLENYRALGDNVRMNSINPAPFDFLTGAQSYRVPYADTDQMGVVYYANYLVYFERSRNELLRATGFTYRELEARGIGLPVVEAHVDYRISALYDDELQLIGKLTMAKGVRLRIDCSVMRGDEELASGYTVHCCMDLKTRKLTRIPHELAKWAPPG